MYENINAVEKFDISNGDSKSLQNNKFTKTLTYFHTNRKSCGSSYPIQNQQQINSSNNTSKKAPLKDSKSVKNFKTNRASLSK